jgi:hypothetical protein
MTVHKVVNGSMMKAHQTQELGLTAMKALAQADIGFPNLTTQ